MPKSLNDLKVSEVPKYHYNKAASEADIPTTKYSPSIPKLPTLETTSVHNPSPKEVIKVKMPGGPDPIVVKPDAKPARMSV